MIAAEVSRQLIMLTGPEPDIDFGPYCSDPYECDFCAYCWAHIPSPSIFDFAGIGKPEGFSLYREDGRLPVTEEKEAGIKKEAGT